MDRAFGILLEGCLFFWGIIPAPLFIGVGLVTLRYPKGGWTFALIGIVPLIFIVTCLLIFYPNKGSSKFIKSYIPFTSYINAPKKTDSPNPKPVSKEFDNKFNSSPMFKD